MRSRPSRSLWVAALVVLLAGLAVWRAQLVAVGGAGARPLRLTPPEARRAVRYDVVLPAAPAGLERLRSGGRVALVHYWAPWQRRGARQIAALDSLRRLPGLEAVDVAVVCFDPFPSVARFVARRRLRTPVLLDSERLLRRTLPCPSVPFTYVVDRSGRIAVEQAGEVDWLAPGTRRALVELAGEAEATAAAAPARSRSGGRRRIRRGRSSTGRRSGRRPAGRPSRAPLPDARA